VNDNSNNLGGLPIPELNRDLGFTAAGFATNALGKLASPAQLWLDYLRNQYAMYDTATNAAKVVGHSQATAVVDSPAYKRFVAEMNERQPTETLIKSVAAIGGAILGGVLLAAFPFGAIIGAIAGGMGGGYLASQMLESKHFDYESFANGLEFQSQNRALNGEQTFVALVLNMENKVEMKSLLKSYGFDKKADFVEALEKNPQLISQMMHEQDGLIREVYNIKNTALTNPQTGRPVTASEMMALHYNSDAAVDPVTGLKGASLLSSEHVDNAVMMLNSRLQHIEQSYSQRTSLQPNPGDIPNLKSPQRTV